MLLVVVAGDITDRQAGAILILARTSTQQRPHKRQTAEATGTRTLDTAAARIHAIIGEQGQPSDPRT